MGVNRLPKTVTRQRRDCYLNPGPSAPESSTLTTRLPSHPAIAGSSAGWAVAVNSAARPAYQCVCVLVASVNPAKAAKPIELPFRWQARMCPRMDGARVPQRDTPDTPWTTAQQG